ncbi:aspartate/glutamate racemase family protein [Ramlibacter tataouinensis]|uniref:Aspartate racemase-like protein n=1 Tax=Ramlibacter tataouinensis (strain ATCC BAA-407 / DSM 14655 / LMG 21543 / TTB310) TaxID=365046 RepID=F5Y4I8_RAMTT|nr:amino acid racemase [Ramlibacter tataouinensis]AEG93835.1 aspartate racemase-like protein [Ramlibacter tataouinensis TTB310]
MIGVLGGMGPLATADFFRKVITLTDARRDEDHVPLLVQSDPRIPPRPAAILHGGESPLPALLAGRDRLIGAGATMLAMPCNTAHHWYAQLVSGCPVPFISIVEASCDAAAGRVPAGAAVGLLATRATLAARLYEPALRARGLRPMLPDDALLDTFVLPAIEDVKAGRLDAAARQVRHAVAALSQRGAQAVVLACTELPIALQHGDTATLPACVDTTLELARACVHQWQAASRR